MGLFIDALKIQDTVPYEAISVKVYYTTHAIIGPAVRNHGSTTLPHSEQQGPSQ